MITQHKVAFPGSNEEMAIRIPNVKEEIYVGLDYYGEVAERLQVLCYEAESDEPKVCIRYDATGKIVEVQIWRGIAITFEDGPRTPWEISRDGAEADNPDDTMPPRDTKLRWYVWRHTDGKFYWYNDQGYPQGPYSEAEQAWQGLEDYDATYYD
jgi:hypothetical protein